MKLFNLSVLSILALTSSTAYATCSTTNPMGNPNAALGAVDKICRYVKGEFPAQASLGGCTTIGSASYETFLVNISGAPRTIDVATCRRLMSLELGCPRGGESTYSDLGWQVWATPRTGRCN